MIVTLIVVLIILLISFGYKNKYGAYVNDEKIREQYIIFVSIILILQSGLRNIAVGADTYGYQLIFEQVSKLNWDTIYRYFSIYVTWGAGKDPGYIVFQKLFSLMIGSNYQLLLIIIATIFFISLGRFLNNFTLTFNNLTLSFIVYIAMFFTFFSITGHRQTISVSFILLGYDYLVKKKLLKLTVCFLIAFFFHKSSIVFIFLPFLYYVNKSPIKIIGLSLITSIILIEFSKEYFDYVKVLVGFDHYSFYYGSGGAYTYTIMLYLISITSIYLYDVIVKLTPYSKLLYYALSLTVLVVPLTWINPTAMRVSYYFSLTLIVFIPVIVQAISIKFYRIHGAVYVAAVFVLLLLFSLNARSLEYKFFWQYMQLPENYYHK